MISTKIIVISLVMLFVISCATTHPGNMGKSLSTHSRLPLVISAENIENSGSKTFQLVEVTFENTSEDWLRVAKAEVVIKNPGESKLSVVTGDDLKFWAQAMELKMKQDDYNGEIGELGLATAGSTALASSEGKNAFLVALAFAAWVTSDIIKHQLTLATSVEKVPENHLYRPFAVPGLMTMRRWVLLNKPVGQVVDKLAIEIETVEGEKEIYEITM